MSDQKTFTREIKKIKKEDLEKKKSQTTVILKDKKESEQKSQ